MTVIKEKTAHSVSVCSDTGSLIKKTTIIINAANENIKGFEKIKGVCLIDMLFIMKTNAVTMAVKHDCDLQKSDIECREV